MNKYARQSKAGLAKNLRANLKAVEAAMDDHDDFDREHEESLDALNARIAASFSVARQMFEVLYASTLSAEGRASAMQLLNVLVHRYSGKDAKKM